MSRHLHDLVFRQLVPGSIRSDSQIAAAADAISPFLQTIVRADHQGYIALFAPDRDMLAVFERDLRVRVGKYHLRLSGLRGQQRQALTAVLPLGL